MQKSIVVAFAVLCLIGTSSLALADDAMKGEMGNMKDEMKAEKNAMKGEKKAKKEEMKAREDAMKGKRHEMKKVKAHKVEGKAKAGEAKDAAQSMGQDMKATVPAAPTSVTAP